MKIWQKTVALVMGLSLFVPFAACGKDEPEPNEPNNPNKPDTPTASQVGTSLVTALKGQLEAAQTLNVKITFSSTSDENEWWDNGDELVEEKYYFEEQGAFNATISKVEKSFAVKVEGDRKYRYDKEGEWEEETGAVYVLDGFIYVWTESYEEGEDGYWEKRALDEGEVESTAAIISMLFEGVEITDKEELSLLSALGELVGETFTLANNAATIAYDLKTPLNDLSTYFKELDLETKTVEQFINDGLALVNEELTVAKVLEQVEDFAGKTIDEAIVAIDAWLTEEYQTTLQGIIDTVTDDPRFATILSNYVTTEGATQDEFSQILSVVKEFDLKKRIAEMEGFGEMKVYDLFMMIAQENSDPETFELLTQEEFFEYIDMTLELPIAEMLPSGLFTQIAQMQVNALDFKTTLNYSSDYKITKIVSELNQDVINKYPSYYDETKFDVEHEKMATAIEIGLSNTATTIALPENADIREDYEEIFNSNFRVDNFNQGDRIFPIDDMNFNGVTGYIYFNQNVLEFEELEEMKAIYGVNFHCESGENGNVVTCIVDSLIGFAPGGYGLITDAERLSVMLNGQKTFTITYDEATDTWTTDLPESWAETQE